MTPKAKDRITKARRRAEAAVYLRMERLLEVADEDTPVHLNVNGEHVDMPPGMVSLLRNYATMARRGLEATLVPTNRALTTQEVADILNVSRPYVIRLMDSGEIPHTRVGNRRRAMLQDILEYREIRNAARSASLSELARLEREEGLYAFEMEAE